MTLPEKNLKRKVLELPLPPFAKNIDTMYQDCKKRRKEIPISSKEGSTKKTGSSSKKTAYNLRPVSVETSSRDPRLSHVPNVLSQTSVKSNLVNDSKPLHDREELLRELNKTIESSVEKQCENTAGKCMPTSSTSRHLEILRTQGVGMLLKELTRKSAASSLEKKVRENTYGKLILKTKADGVESSNSSFAVKPNSGHAKEVHILQKQTSEQVSQQKNESVPVIPKLGSSSTSSSLEKLPPYVIHLNSDLMHKRQRLSQESSNRTSFSVLPVASTTDKVSCSKDIKVVGTSDSEDRRKTKIPSKETESHSKLTKPFNVAFIKPLDHTQQQEKLSHSISSNAKSCSLVKSSDLRFVRTLEAAHHTKLSDTAHVKQAKVAYVRPMDVRSNQVCVEDSSVCANEVLLDLKDVEESSFINADVTDSVLPVSELAEKSSVRPLASHGEELTQLKKWQTSFLTAEVDQLSFLQKDCDLHKSDCFVRDSGTMNKVASEQPKITNTRQTPSEQCSLSSNTSDLNKNSVPQTKPVLSLNVHDSESKKMLTNALCTKDSSTLNVEQSRRLPHNFSEELVLHAGASAVSNASSKQPKVTNIKQLQTQKKSCSSKTHDLTQKRPVSIARSTGTKPYVQDIEIVKQQLAEFRRMKTEKIRREVEMKNKVKKSTNGKQCAKGIPDSVPDTNYAFLLRGAESFARKLNKSRETDPLRNKTSSITDVSKDSPNMQKVVPTSVTVLSADQILLDKSSCVSESSLNSSRRSIEIINDQMFATNDQGNKDPVMSKTDFQYQVPKAEVHPETSEVMEHVKVMKSTINEEENDENSITKSVSLNREWCEDGAQKESIVPSLDSRSPGSDANYVQEPLATCIAEEKGTPSQVETTSDTYFQKRLDVAMIQNQVADISQQKLPDGIGEGKMQDEVKATANICVQTLTEDVMENPENIAVDTSLKSKSCVVEKQVQNQTKATVDTSVQTLDVTENPLTETVDVSVQKSADSVAIVNVLGTEAKRANDVDTNITETETVDNDCLCLSDTDSDIVFVAETPKVPKEPLDIVDLCSGDSDGSADLSIDEGCTVELKNDQADEKEEYSKLLDSEIADRNSQPNVWVKVKVKTEVSPPSTMLDENVADSHLTSRENNIVTQSSVTTEIGCRSTDRPKSPKNSLVPDLDQEMRVVEDSVRISADSVCDSSIALTVKPENNSEFNQSEYCDKSVVIKQVSSEVSSSIKVEQAKCFSDTSNPQCETSLSDIIQGFVDCTKSFGFAIENVTSLSELSAEKQRKSKRKSPSKNIFEMFSEKYGPELKITNAVSVPSTSWESHSGENVHQVPSDNHSSNQNEAMLVRASCSASKVENPVIGLEISTPEKECLGERIQSQSACIEQRPNESSIEHYVAEFKRILQNLYNETDNPETRKDDIKVQINTLIMKIQKLERSIQLNKGAQSHATEVCDSYVSDIEKCGETSNQCTERAGLKPSCSKVHAEENISIGKNRMGVPFSISKSVSNLSLNDNGNKAVPLKCTNVNELSDFRNTVNADSKILPNKDSDKVYETQLNQTEGNNTNALFNTTANSDKFSSSGVCELPPNINTPSINATLPPLQNSVQNTNTPVGQLSANSPSCTDLLHPILENQTIQSNILSAECFAAVPTLQTNKNSEAHVHSSLPCDPNSQITIPLQTKDAPKSSMSTVSTNADIQMHENPPKEKDKFTSQSVGQQSYSLQNFSNQLNKFEAEELPSPQIPFASLSHAQEDSVLEAILKCSPIPQQSDTNELDDHTLEGNKTASEIVQQDNVFLSSFISSDANNSTAEYISTDFCSGFSSDDDDDAQVAVQQLQCQSSPEANMSDEQTYLQKGTKKTRKKVNNIKNKHSYSFDSNTLPQTKQKDPMTALTNFTLGTGKDTVSSAATSISASSSLEVQSNMSVGSASVNYGYNMQRVSPFLPNSSNILGTNMSGYPHVQPPSYNEFLKRTAVQNYKGYNSYSSSNNQQHDTCTTTSSTYPTVSSQRPLANSTYLPANCGYPTASSTNPTVNCGYPTASSVRLLASLAYPTASSSHPAASSSYPTASSCYPATNSTYPTASSGHPAASSSYPTASSGHPATNSTYPAASSSHPTASLIYPSTRSVYPVVNSTYLTGYAPSSLTPYTPANITAVKCCAVCCRQATFRCKRCLGVYYCSEYCSRINWSKVHFKECKDSCL